MPESSVSQLQAPPIKRSEWSDIDVFSDVALQAITLARKTRKPEAVSLAQDLMMALHTRVHRVNWRDGADEWEPGTEPPNTTDPAYAGRVH